MICGLIMQVVPALACPGDPLASSFGSWLAIAVALVAVWWAILRSRTAVERLGTFAVVVAAFGLGFSAGLPELRAAAPEATGGRIVAVVDASESMRRDGVESYQLQLARFADALDGAAGEGEQEADWSGYVVRFSGTAETVAGPVPLQDVGSAIRNFSAGPIGDASDLSAGLDLALDRISEGTGGGSIWLLTDGWTTVDEPKAVLQRAQAMGIPIHFLGAGAQVVGEGLLATDLGPEQWVGAPSIARLTVLGAGEMEWAVNGVEGATLAIEHSDYPRGARLPAVFAERGLGHIGVEFHAAVGSHQSDTLYTLVRGPARILAFGDALWLNSLPQAGYLVDRHQPTDDVDLAIYDAVVIDGISPDAFEADFPAKLLNRAAGGAGVLIVNGPQIGSEEDTQRIALWEETELGPVLPVNSDSEKFFSEPPRRDVLIILDTSGSMAGSRLAFANLIAKRIVDALRPQDTLVILPFSTTPATPFRSSGVDASERRRAEGFLRSQVAGGGTGIGDALDAAGGLVGNYCAVFVIGDGEYQPGSITNRPICQTVTIGVAGGRLPGINTDHGNALAYRPGDDISDLEFGFFEPEERTRFWREGPLAVRPAEPGSVYDGLGPIGGAALSYLRPEAEPKILVRSPPPDPVLAYRSDLERRRLVTGVFLGEVPATWSATSEGRGAITEMIDTLIGWRNPDRYGIELERQGERFFLRVTASGPEPAPLRLSAALEIDGRPPIGFNMGATSVPGEFVGEALVTLRKGVQRGLLDLSTSSGDTELIPIVLPSRSARTARGAGVTLESLSQGVNEALLEAIRLQTGGMKLGTDRPSPLAQEALPDQVTTIWPATASLSAFTFALSLLAGGMRR